jgi:hypothetical protein
MINIRLRMIRGGREGAEIAVSINGLRMMSVAAVALISNAQTPSSSAAELVPLHTTSHLRGTLTFHPGGGGHFKCKAHFILDTRKGNLKRGAEVRSAAAPDCPGELVFGGLPWSASASNDGETAAFRSLSWRQLSGPECTEGAQPFTVNKSGVWTATIGCVTGSLTFDPPITIQP